MYKIAVYIPESDTETVKTAMFLAGAGRLGHYEQVSWQVLGQGQFRPLEGSSPAIGEQDKLEKLAEYRVEMQCEEPFIADVIAAMKAAHPYEEPAYEVVRLID